MPQEGEPFFASTGNRNQLHFGVDPRPQ